MIFDGHNPIVKFVNAEHLKWGQSVYDVAPRQYSALAFRLQGSADMICGGKHFLIDAGDVLYMPQGLGYQVKYSTTDMYVLHFVTANDDALPEVYHLQNHQEIQLLFKEAVEYWRARSSGYENFCTGILYRVLGMLCSQDTLEQYPVGFQRALQFIHENYRQKITTADICKYAGISPTSFRQNFQTYCHTNYIDYIRDMRLAYARRLIAGGVSIEQAAQLCGIGDPKYFARLVYKKYGCTPRQLKSYGKV